MFRSLPTFRYNYLYKLLNKTDNLKPVAMSWQQAVLLASSGHSCLTGRSAILILDEQTYTKHRSLKERERENDVYILFFATQTSNCF